MEYIVFAIVLVLVLPMVYFGLKSKYTAEISRLTEKSDLLEEEIEKKERDLSAKNSNELNLTKTVTELESDNKHLQERIKEQEKNLIELQEKMSKEFEILANKILEEKSTKFTNQNKENIESILKPLNTKILEFEQKVSQIHVNDSKDREALKEQIKNLSQLNQQMSQDAENLTKALKGDSKTQGTWGEIILETVLEKSGLVKGEQYSVQESLKSEGGKTYRPDVIIYLPDNKNIVVDSKVSLTDYERFVSSEDSKEKERFLKAHINSISAHIKELGAKSYQNLYGINSPDFVLMFVPIEPAFGLAVQSDANIFYNAFNKNIVIVSPSTLLATLRTIESIWKQENQNKNAIEIAKQSGMLYDKFEGLLKDLLELGKKIDDSKTKYSDAINKLSDGRGNLISRVEKLKKLGAKASKNLPETLLDKSVED